MEPMDGLRIDKWLWAARFFKTRSISQKACELGRIQVNGTEAKPSRDVKVGDTLRIRNEGGECVVEVLLVSDMRGQAAIAQTMYRETDASREARAKLAEERKLMPQFDLYRDGKPSKRDRRDIGKLRGRY